MRSQVAAAAARQVVPGPGGGSGEPALLPVKGGGVGGHSSDLLSSPSQAGGQIRVVDPQ